jgi:DNA repair protein RadC
MNHLEKIPINLWSEDDRPREKLLLKGKSVLSDAELLAILIGSGNNEESAVALSRRILTEAVENNLNKLARLSVADLTKFKGIGEAKAITIVAALELARRRKTEDQSERVKLSTSKNGYDFIKGTLMDLPFEEFWVLHLNRANYITHKTMISRGGVVGTIADTRLIFKSAIEQLSTAIILCHNHPSGNLKPSDQDIQLTKRLVETGKIMEIPVLDHLIVTDNGYFSFADEGMI